MRIITTDTSLIWHPENPKLEKFKDVLLVVCLNGKQVTDKYECFISPYKHVGMDLDELGTESQKCIALESVADDLNRSLECHDTILFLTDGTPESLYPFYVIKDRNEYNSLHLCTVSPWNFEGKRRKKAHKDLLSDLSQLKSIMYINSNAYLSRLDKRSTMAEAMQIIANEYNALLPIAINSIYDMRDASYYDFASKSYVPISEGFNEINISNITDKNIEIEVPLVRSYSTLGLIMPSYYPEEDEHTKEGVERLSARLDGKKICNYLRAQRMKLAESNGIEFYSEECPSIGPCAGTCAKCDQEAAYLRDRLNSIPEEKRVIPDFELTTWEVE